MGRGVARQALGHLGCWPAGGCPVPARPASGPANQPFGVVAAVELTSCKVPGRRECGAGTRGRLGATIRSAFPALQARASGGDTVLTGPLPDRAALYGVLAQLEPERLELVEVRRLPPA